MKRTLLLLFAFLACDSATAPFSTEEHECPDGMEPWHWSYMDSLGVLTKKDLCLPGGTFDSVFGRTEAVPADSTGSITLIICRDGICPDGTIIPADST